MYVKIFLSNTRIRIILSSVLSLLCNFCFKICNTKPSQREQGSCHLVPWIQSLKLTMIRELFPQFLTTVFLTNSDEAVKTKQFLPNL